MKYFIIFTICSIGLVLVQITAAESKATPENINKKCIEKTGVDAKELKYLEKGDFSKLTKPSPHLQCYIKCILEHTELLEEEKIKKSVLEKKFSKTVPKAQLEKAMSNCAHFQGKNHCAAAFSMMKCYADNKVKLF